MKSTDTSSDRRARIRHLLREVQPAHPQQDAALTQLTHCFEQLVDFARTDRSGRTTKRRLLSIKPA